MLGAPRLEGQQLMVVELLVFAVDELLHVLLGQRRQMGNVQMLALRACRRLEVNWNGHCKLVFKYLRRTCVDRAIVGWICFENVFFLFRLNWVFQFAQILHALWDYSCKQKSVFNSFVLMKMCQSMKTAQFHNQFTI